MPETGIDVYGNPTVFYPEMGGGESGQDVYGNEAPPWWALLGPGIITATGATLSNIFRRYPEQQTYQTAYRYPTTGTYQGVETGGAGGQTIDSLARWASNNWIILAVGALILFFPGFQRRRNPARRNPARAAKRSPRRRNARRSRRR